MHRHTSRARRLVALPQVVLAVYLIGCGGAAPGASRTPDDLQRPASQRESTGAQAFSDVRVSRQATTLQLPCEYNAYEECNALDDDCNGVIDDQCGYESGAVQITVGWNSGADIDLYVTDPSGATLYYNELHKRSRLGGHLDHDARGDCRKEQANPRIENAYWPSARAGTYRVELHYFSPCAQTAATEATLSVVVRGQLLGAYRVRLEPEQRVEAVSFVMQ